MAGLELTQSHCFRCLLVFAFKLEDILQHWELDLMALKWVVIQALLNGYRVLPEQHNVISVYLSNCTLLFLA